jgi:hypothetical protein
MTGELKFLLFFAVALTATSGCSNPQGSTSNIDSAFHPGIPSKITQIQTTPLGTQVSGATVSASFATKPTVGNAILLYTWAYDNAQTINIPATSCTDNQGHVYRSAVVTVDSSGGTHLTTAICYVTNIGISTLPFTVTVAPTLGNAATQIEAMAVEYYGLAVNPVDKTAVSNGNSASAATGTTLVTTQNIELVAAIINSGASANPITFASLYNFITLTTQNDCSGFACGLAETKTVSTTSPYVENWNVNATAFYDTVIATFKAD